MGMAKRKYSKRSKKIEPAEMTLTFGLPVGPGAQINYIDLSQVASLQNRRFYRQGINWAVAGFKFIGVSGLSGEITITKLPNTWVTANAWEKTMRTWMKMNREALEEAESVRPKFLDFKIYADADHHQAGYAANLLPGGITAGEWEPSKIVFQDNSAVPAAGLRDMEIIAVGPNYPGGGASGLNAVSMIEGYAASRGLPDVLDPNAPADAADANGPQPANWMAAMFNDGTLITEQVLDDMITENNIAPYPFENDGTHTDTMYPGGANQAPFLQVHDYTNLTASSISSISYAKGGNFPCGLIRIDTTNFSADTNVLMLIDLVPGDHRGYLCEPMTEM